MRQERPLRRGIKTQPGSAQHSIPGGSSESINALAQHPEHSERGRALRLLCRRVAVVWHVLVKAQNQQMPGTYRALRGKDGRAVEALRHGPPDFGVDARGVSQNQ